MRLWRIAAETRDYPADDLSGMGAAKYPGRWNERGGPVVYAAPTLAIAVLETAAHIDSTGLPLNRFVVAIDVPESVWTLREQAEVTELPAAWDSIPAGRASIRFGSDWLRLLKSSILLVPSVIVPEDHVALINPRHPASAQIKASVSRPFRFDRLFRPDQQS